MNYEDYQLLTYPQILKLIKDFLEETKETKSIKETYNIFVEKYPRYTEVHDFALGGDKEISIERIFAFIEKVEELNEIYPKIKDCNFNSSIPKILKELGKKGDELFIYHSKAFKYFDDMETNWTVDIPKSDKYIVEYKFYVELSNYINRADMFSYIGLALEKYIKKDNEISKQKEKIKLVFLGVRGLCLDSDKKLCYSPKDNTKIYSYLEKIIKNKGKPASAKELNSYLKEKWKANSRISINKAIASINKLTKEKLGLQNNLILSEQGYKLNTEDYQII